MTAIVCVGEVERGRIDDVTPMLEQQVRLLRGCDPSRLILAYEPAWAIGVGAQAAAARWVGQVHGAIRDLIRPSGSGKGSSSSLLIPIIYGGSVGPEGAGPLLAEPGVDGLFVGRSALDPRVFAAIAHTPLPGQGRTH
jgi:triosephosphate isomerase